MHVIRHLKILKKLKILHCNMIECSAIWYIDSEKYDISITTVVKFTSMDIKIY